LPKTIPRLIDNIAPQLITFRQIVCPSCFTLFDGATCLRAPDGTITTCTGCRTRLGDFHRAKGAKLGVRPSLTVARCGLRAALTALWQSAEFAGLVINEDPTRPSSSMRSQRYADLVAQHPVLMAQRGTLRATLYVDYFQFSRHARTARRGQFGSIYLRIDNLAPHISKNAEYVIQLATLTGTCCL
jgi:hypothetical protein